MKKDICKDCERGYGLSAGYRSKDGKYTEGKTEFCHEQEKCCFHAERIERLNNDRTKRNTNKKAKSAN